MALAFFVSDVAGALAGVLLFALVLIVPGYVSGFMGDLFGFRHLDLNWRLAASTPLSVALSPSLVYLGLRFGAMPLVLVLFGVLWIWAALLFSGRFGHEGPRLLAAGLKRIPLCAFLVAGIWLLVAILSLADLQIGQRVYYSVIARDHGIRVAVTDAITRGGIPTESPFIRLNHPTPLRYHVFWFAVCSFVQRLGAGLLNARDALNASIVWAGFSVMALIALWLRMFERVDPAAVRRRALIAIGLLSVTGLDLIPMFVKAALKGRVPDGDMEWWAPDQITSWADAALWVPHHVAGLVAGLTGFLLIWFAAQQRDESRDAKPREITRAPRQLDPAAMKGRQTRRSRKQQADSRPDPAPVLVVEDDDTPRAKWTHAAAAGCAFASVAGCSVHMAVAFAVVLTVWFVVALIRRWYWSAGLLAMSAAVAVVVGLPYLLQFGGSGGDRSLIQTGIWDATLFSKAVPADLWTSTGMEAAALHLLALPLAYGIEFGLFGLLGIVRILQFRRGGKLRAQDFVAALMAGTALLLCTFVRSVPNNDLGWRGVMIVQFILLIWAAGMLDPYLPSGSGSASGPVWIRFAWPFLIVGLVGTLFQLTMLRMDNLVSDTGYFGTRKATHTGQKTWSLRTIYTALDRRLPPNAVIQGNPVDRSAWGLYSQRQSALTILDWDLEFGGDLAARRLALSIIGKLFARPVFSVREAEQVAQIYGIDAVVVSDTDPVWSDPNGWIYRMQPYIVMPNAKAFVFGRFRRTGSP